MKLKGKVAIVVGAGQSVSGEDCGNGRATAIAFAREGASVLLADHDEQSLRETHSLIVQEGGTAALAVMDITQEAACAELTMNCRRLFGRLDVLHNNVGIAGADGPVESLDERVWTNLMRVNALGPSLMCKHALPVMREQGGGSIINVSSVVSIMTVESLVGYSMSKAALNSLTRHVAAVGAPDGIRANTLVLGRISTPLAIEGVMQKRGITDRDLFVKTRMSGIPLANVNGTGWDVASAAVFFASDDSKFITGVQLPIDGGQSTL